MFLRYWVHLQSAGQCRGLLPGPLNGSPAYQPQHSSWELHWRWPEPWTNRGPEDEHSRLHVDQWVICLSVCVNDSLGCRAVSHLVVEFVVWRLTGNWGLLVGSDLCWSLDVYWRVMAYLHKAVNRSCIIIIVAIFYCVYGEAQTFIFFIFVS